VEISLEVFFLFVAVAIVAGGVDAIAGGAGLITIPAMLAFGVPPAAAIATNKLGGVAGTLSATLHFIGKKQIDIRAAWPLAATAFIGSVAGGFALTRIEPAFLAAIVPVLLIGFSVYFIFSPNVGALDTKRRVSVAGFVLLVAPAIGFYDGFFGPGAGAFFCLALVLLAGFNLIRATAHAKLLNLASNLAALLFFIWHGTILWDIGLAMMVGQFIGGNLGARIVVRHGVRVIKIIMVVVACAISLKLML